MPDARYQYIDKLLQSIPFDDILCDNLSIYWNRAPDTSLHRFSRMRRNKYYSQKL